MVSNFSVWNIFRKKDSRIVFIIRPDIKTLILFIFFVTVAGKMVKEWNFVVDLRFDERFVKYYHFSMHYHLLNNIKLKYSQFGQEVQSLAVPAKKLLT